MSFLEELEIGDTRVEFIAEYVIKTLRVKPVAWTKMYSAEEVKQMYLDFFEKGDLPTLVVIATPAGTLVTQFEWPSNPKAKACYFVKKTREGVNKDSSFRNTFLYGDLSYAPLDQLSAFVDEVNLVDVVLICYNKILYLHLHLRFIFVCSFLSYLYLFTYFLDTCSNNSVHSHAYTYIVTDTTF